MNPDRFQKILRLAEQGATEGERQAAREAMKRILDKVDAYTPDAISFKACFTYSTWIDEKILSAILTYNDYSLDQFRKHTYKQKTIRGVDMDREDFITIEAMYQYFRKHAKAEFEKHGKPLINRIRSKGAKAKAKRRFIEMAFIQEYCIKSGLFKKENLVPITDSKLIDMRSKLAGVKGGSYTEQIGTGYYLNDKN